MGLYDNTFLGKGKARERTVELELAGQESLVPSCKFMIQNLYDLCDLICTIYKVVCHAFEAF